MSSNNLFQSLRRLAYFAAVADTGSIKAAAERLGLSVPVMSTALSELEEELGLKLAVRSTRKFELTAAGFEVYEHAQRMLHEADQALNLAAFDASSKGELSITIPVELGSNWLPAHLLVFRQRFPNISLSIHTDDVLVPLRTSEHDLAITAVYRPPNYSSTSPLTRSVVSLGRINLVCVAAKRPRVNWQQSLALMNIPLIEMKHRGDKLHALEKKTNRAVLLKGTTVIKTNNHLTALSMALAGLGAVMVMEDSVRSSIAEKRLVRVLPGCDFGHLELELKSRDSLPSPATKAFIHFLTQRCL